MAVFAPDASVTYNAKHMSRAVAPDRTGPADVLPPWLVTTSSTPRQLPHTGHSRTRNSHTAPCDGVSPLPYPRPECHRPDRSCRLSCRPPRTRSTHQQRGRGQEDTPDRWRWSSSLQTRGSTADEPRPLGERGPRACLRSVATYRAPPGEYLSTPSIHSPTYVSPPLPHTAHMSHLLPYPPRIPYLPTYRRPVHTYIYPLFHSPTYVSPPPRAQSTPQHLPIPFV